MEASYANYDYQESLERISEILEGADASYETKKNVPSRGSLTFTNGFYVDVTVVFIDIRGSKELSEKHTRPVIAKIYRAYISEAIAVLRGNMTISEIYIEGDGVWAVFDTTTKTQVNSVFETAAKVASLVDILNIKLEKKGYSKIDIGIGIDDDESLYIKAGYKGAAINEVVWIGKVVGSAAALCKNGNRTALDNEMMISETIYGNLNDEYKEFFDWNQSRMCYHANVHNLLMNEWVSLNA